MPVLEVYAVNEKEEDWKKCFELCREFLRIYPESKWSPEIKGSQYFYKKMGH